MESILYQNRPRYYQAIEDASSANDSGGFIEFTLSALLNSIIDQVKHQEEHQEEHQEGHQDKHQVELTETQRSILEALEEGTLSRREIFARIGINGDTRAFKRHIEPLLTEGLVEMTVPGKPNSKLQKYRLTDSGKSAIQ